MTDLHEAWHGEAQCLSKLYNCMIKRVNLVMLLKSFSLAGRLFFVLTRNSCNRTAIFKNENQILTYVFLDIKATTLKQQILKLCPYSLN